MNDIQIIENQNQRVMLTSQLAEVYETTDKVIVDNFNNNKDRYQEGKHYNLLQGEDLKKFKSENENFGFAKNLNKLYLWTEKGAALHAKSLSTDKAWEMYELLVDTYFEVKQEQIPVKQLSQIEIIAQMAQANVQLEHKVTSIEQKANKTSDKLDNALDILAKPITDGWKEKINHILNQICQDNSISYSVFKGDLYAELESIASCDITARQRNLKARLKKGGATYKECQAVTKIDVIERDEKLKLIFDGIVKRHQAKYLQ